MKTILKRKQICSQRLCVISSAAAASPSQRSTSFNKLELNENTNNNKYTRLEIPSLLRRNAFGPNSNCAPSWVHLQIAQRQGVELS